MASKIIEKKKEKKKANLHYGFIVGLKPLLNNENNLRIVRFYSSNLNYSCFTHQGAQKYQFLHRIEGKYIYILDRYTGCRETNHLHVMTQA